jgi:site-specific DNA-methyltransferase (adenine-specific)
MPDAARFFYCAKASKADRDEGCDGLDARKQDETRNEGDPGGDNPRNRGAGERSNHHPTVKPTDLMRYLCRLVTPPGGTVLDPFMGSGSTGKAATLEGFRFVGCELQPEYMAIAEARIRHAEGEVEPLLRVRS